MSLMHAPIKSSQTINDTLTDIEAELRPALITAIKRINTVLAGDVAENDTAILHHHASGLHDLVQMIDENKERRQRARQY